MKFRDVAHHYIGCDLHDSFMDRTVKLHYTMLSASFELTHGSRYKPLLLSLEDMTEEDMKEVFKLIFKRDFPESGNIQFRPDTSLTSDPRWILWSGVDRVGIEISGDVWADCDLSKHKFNPHIITHYLTSKHYDIFGLIDSGEAIRKTV